MTKNEKIEVFIKACFNELCLDFADYFSYTDDNGKSRLVPLLHEGKLNEDAVQFTSRILGLSVYLMLRRLSSGCGSSKIHYR